MKYLLVFCLLAIGIEARAVLPCLTNVNITCLNGATVSISGGQSGCYNTIETYTNITCPDLIAPDSNSGTVINITVANCPTSPLDVATVNYQCSQGVYCSMSQGGANYCTSGGSFTITMPPGVNMFAFRIYPNTVCCSMNWAEVWGTRVNCSYGGGDK